MAARYSIVGKAREFEIAPSRAQDFTLGTAAPFEATEILDSGLDGRLRYTLYCLDANDDTALFVETENHHDLEAAPFFYSAQYEHARAVIKLSRGEFFHLVQQTGNPGPLLGWVQSVGRSGTTLASRAFGTCSGVYSLSEPDVLMQVLALRPSGPNRMSSWACADDSQFDALFDACVRFVCHEAMRSRRYQKLIIKPRSQVCEAFASISRLYPHSKTLFLSRAPLPWLTSVFSALLRELDGDDEEVLSSFESSLGSYIPLIRERIRPGAHQSMGALWALHYVSAIREAEAAKAAGLPVHFLTFEELEQDPRKHFEALFERWGLLWDDAALARVLEQDSQAGSGLAREGAGRAEYVVPQHHIENGAAVFREFGLV